MEALDICLNPYFTGLSILIEVENKGGFWLAVSQSLFYWIIYSYVRIFKSLINSFVSVSILILLDYLFLSSVIITDGTSCKKSQSLFYWIIYSYDEFSMWDK